MTHELDREETEAEYEIRVAKSLALFDKYEHELNTMDHDDESKTKILVSQARILIRLRKYPCAEEILDKVVTIDPNNSDALVERSFLLLAQGDLLESLFQIEISLSINQYNLRALINRTWMYVSRTRLVDSGLSSLELAHKIDPGNIRVDYLAEKMGISLPPVVEKFDVTLRKIPLESSINAMYLNASMLYRSGLYTKSLELTSKIISQQPNHVETRVLRGDIFYHKLNYHFALVEYRIAVHWDSTHPRALFGCARCYQKHNLIDLAFKYLEPLHAVEAFTLDSKYLLGELLDKSNRREEAKSEFIKVTQICENIYEYDNECISDMSLKSLYIRALINIALISCDQLNTSRDGDSVESIRDMVSRAEALLPQNLFVALSAAEIDMQLGYVEEARSRLEKLLEKHPHHCGALILYGIACDRLEDRQEALHYFVRAIVSNPQETGELSAYKHLLSWYHKELESSGDDIESQIICVIRSHTRDQTQKCELIVKHWKLLLSQ